MPSVAEARPLSSASPGQRAEMAPLTPAVPHGKAKFVASVTSPAGWRYEVYDAMTADRKDVFLDGKFVSGFAAYASAFYAIRDGEMDGLVRQDKPVPACALEDPELFFPITEAGKAAERQIEKAKAVCQRCPLLEECRTGALARGEEFGIWGGLSATERRALQRSAARQGVAA